MITTLLLSAAIAVPLQADLHLDTPTQLHRKGLALDAAQGLEGGLPQLQAGGTNLAVEVLWPPRTADWRSHTFRLLGLLEAEDARLEGFELARSPAQARTIIESNRIAYIVSLEGAHGLGSEDWQGTLDSLQARGLAILGMTWSMSNDFAGSSGDQGLGLTEQGRALVAHARSKGILIDLSHASRQTTLEICRDAPAPVIASHSNAHALQAHPRNLTDEEIRCIAATGGVIGLGFHAPLWEAHVMFRPWPTTPTTWPPSAATPPWPWAVTSTVSSPHQRA